MGVISSLTMNKTTGASLLVLGAATGAMLMLFAQNKKRREKKCLHCLLEAKDRRARLPPMILLVRHGESEGNADKTLFRTKPDNLVELTEKGVKQANKAGKRVESIFKEYELDHLPIKRVHIIVSPFERTLQTALAMRSWFEHRVVRTETEPRIREQEFGNLQGDEFHVSRNEQKQVGRFWYRFPTGESGADVHDRVKSWWYESVLSVNDRVGYDPIDALVVVTHGLTMRFVLMQLYGWSPTTFHSVWNAGNCDVYVLKKDLDKPGMSPYVLDDKHGDIPKSSIDLLVEFKNGESKVYKLEDYLKVPPPRTTRLEIVKDTLAEQYGSINKEDIVNITFMPFIDGKSLQGRTTTGSKTSTRRSGFKNKELATPETSFRFPSFSSCHGDIEEL